MGWFSNVVHGVLDVAGMIPGVGAVADGLNAVIYAAEGDYANAALSAVAMIPGIGDSIALASKGAKVMKGIKGLSKLEKAKFLVKGLKKQGAKVLDSMKGLMKEGATFLKNFDYKGAWKNAIEKGKHILGLGRCFAGDTLVYAEKGYIPIREIQKGDYVWSMNEETGETGLKKVEEVFCTEAHTIHEITVEGIEVIKATAYHPFYVSEKGWVHAISLQVGDMLQTPDGKAEITQISKSRYDEPMKTYNFHVDEWSSYFVSMRNVYVHNPVDDHGLVSKVLGGKNFKDHFIRHKGLLQNLTGKKYSKFKSHAEEFLDDIGKVINEGKVPYVGKGTLKKGQDVCDIFRGNGVTIAIKENGEFVTILESGTGMDKAIQMLI